MTAPIDPPDSRGDHGLAALALAITELARTQRMLMRAVLRHLVPDRIKQPPTQAEPAPVAQQTSKSTLDVDIIALLRRSGPLKGSVVARRLGREETYVRRRLAKLRASGRIVNGVDGYELPASATVAPPPGEVKDSPSPTSKKPADLNARLDEMARAAENGKPLFDRRS